MVTAAGRLIAREVIRRVRSTFKPLDRAVDTAEKVGGAASRSIARARLGDAAQGRTVSAIGGGQIQRALAETGLNITDAQGVELFHLGLGLNALGGLATLLGGGAATLGVPLELEARREGLPSVGIPGVLGPTLGNLGELGVFTRRGQVTIQMGDESVDIEVPPLRRAPGTARAVRAGLFKRDSRGRLLALSPRDRKKCEDAGFFEKKKRR